MPLSAAALTRNSPRTPETPEEIKSPFLARRTSKEIQDLSDTSSDESNSHEVLREGGDNTVSSTELWNAIESVTTTERVEERAREEGPEEAKAEAGDDPVDEAENEEGGATGQAEAWPWSTGREGEGAHVAMNMRGVRNLARRGGIKASLGRAREGGIKKEVKKEPVTGVKRKRSLGSPAGNFQLM